MKRLLSVVAILVIAASLLPVKGQAGLRGAFDPISNSDNLIRGKFSPTLRGVPFSGAGTAASPKVERWLAFCTLSQILGSESCGEIWLYRNASQAFLTIGDPVPVLRDPNGVVSYIDPAWSKDGKWLAYVQTNNSVSQSSIYVQQYDTSTATDGNVPLGAPILVADGSGGSKHRHPAFNGAGTQIAYDSDAFGPSIDLWTVDISLDPVAHTGTVNQASRTRHQLGLEGTQEGLNILNGKAEFKPAYSPDGTKIAYVTNRYGPFQIQILAQTVSGLGEVVTPAESNPAIITHDNPCYSSDGASLYYDAASGEDPANPQDIWKLDLASGQKCNIFIDATGDVDPNVSQYVNTTSDGIAFNFFVFISQAAGFGVQIWRGEYVQNCIPALPVAVSITPSQVDLDHAHGTYYQAAVTYPQATFAAGYVCRPLNIGGEGIRMRESIIASPTLLGLRMANTSTDPKDDCTSMYQEITGDFSTTSIDCETMYLEVTGTASTYGWWTFVEDTTGAAGDLMNVYWGQKTINARIVALGLVGKYVPLTYRAYSNRIGRQFIGFGYIKLSKKNLASSSVVLQQNFPNPFNPATKVNFAVDKAGNVDVRVFNTRGELVRTIVNQWYPQGEHTVSWDGKTLSGGHAPSGIYYIRATSAGGTDVIKAVLAK